MPKGTPKTMTLEELEQIERENARRLAIKKVAIRAQQAADNSDNGQDILTKFEAWRDAERQRHRKGHIPKPDTIEKRIKSREDEITKLQAEVKALKLAKKGDSSGLDSLRDTVSPEEFQIATKSLLEALPEASEDINSVVN